MSFCKNNRKLEVEWAGIQSVPLQMKKTEAPERTLAVTIPPGPVS